jgi:beta-lactamase class A
MRFLLLVLALIGTAPSARAGALDMTTLPAALQDMVDKFDGSVGVCARDAIAPVCVHGSEAFPMESVAKLVVAIAVLDAVDRLGWRLDEPMILKQEDASVLIPAAAPLVPAPEGSAPTLDDLLSRMVIDSDSAATDVLIRRLGGPAAVQAVLDRQKLDGVRIDRDERHLQTEFLGLEWRPNYIDNATLGRAVSEIPVERRQQALDAFLADPRDTATPSGMVALLAALQSGRLLSPASTAHLLKMMKDTTVFPDRLKAGIRPGWSIGHKTGTSATWRGIAAATNDVGILTARDGGGVIVAVFIKGSRRSAKERADLIAQIARQIVDAYH